MVEELGAQGDELHTQGHTASRGQNNTDQAPWQRPSVPPQACSQTVTTHHVTEQVPVLHTTGAQFMFS